MLIGCIIYVVIIDSTSPRKKIKSKNDDKKNCRGYSRGRHHVGRTSSRVKGAPNKVGRKEKTLL